MDPNEGTPGPTLPPAPPSAPPAAPDVQPPPFLTPPLPPVGDYLRQVIALGRASLVPALPALVLLYCYRFGMGLYLVFTGAMTSPLGFSNSQAYIGTILLMATASLPLLVLVYTPILPFLDAILRGGRRSFIDCVKQVLELTWPYGLSSILQLFIIALPAFALVFGAALLTLPLANLPDPARVSMIMLAAIPACVWVVVAMFFLGLATPLLILDGRGPVASIGESIRLVRRHFGGLFGRVFVLFALIIVAALFLALPSAMLSIVGTVARQRIIGLEIAKVAWDSVVSMAIFPFTVAGLLILYRALVPAAGAGELARSPEGVVRLPIQGETTSATPPYRFE